MQKKSWTFARKIAVLFVLASLLGTYAGEAQAATVASAPLQAQGGTENGMVRVYLSSLGNPSTLNLTVLGSYSVNGNTSQSISSGSSLTVGFSSSTGAITLTRNGVKTNMGSYFALRRHSTTGTNGVKIAQGRKPENPYPGDISFRAVQSGGSYKLYTVVHVYIENYLYGVLPYEMGSGAHIEALKAQAVAARTYTVRMMQSRSSGYYDVVDTTSDQVYNGTPAGNSTCTSAVDATKGIVVKNGSSYTATYYSASNGGQTESILNAWGTSGYAYLGVKDDPFDLANPDCVVKRYTVYGEGASNGSSLLSLLKSKAVTALKNSGYSATLDNTTIQTVKNITPHTPKYSAPSKLYTKLDFSLAVKTGSAASTTVTVTCGIFTELESMLGMSIQSTTNELWSVGKSGSNFVLEARRFGHGIGLSQRGAMYMGRQGYTYDQILGFYYTNCSRVRIGFTNSILSANGSESITVEDPASLEDNDAACTAVVKLTGSASSLGIRAEKATSGKLLGVLTNNSPVSVYANDGTWCFVRFGSIKGYVPTNALTLSGTAPKTTKEKVSQTIGFATVQANGYLNLRSSGSTSASVVTTAPTGAVLTVFSKENGWAHVQFGATAAYASADFLALSSGYPGEVVNTGSMTAVVSLDNAGGTLKLYSAASTDGKVLAKIPHGAEVTVIRDDGSWCEVSYKGTKGYVTASSLQYSKEEVEEGSGTPVRPETTDSTATVQVTKGILYEEQNKKSTVLMEIPMGQSVVVTEAGSKWCAVRYEGAEGYMLTETLRLQTPSGQAGGGSGMKATVATQQGSLNLRMTQSAGSAILGTIPKGAQLTVTSRGETWSAVEYNGISGYVMTLYLQFDAGSAPEGTTPDPAQGTGSLTATVVTQSGSLNLRAEGRAGSAILRTIPPNATVTVLQRGTEWCQVSYEGVTGHAMTVFLSFVETAPGETMKPSGASGREASVTSSGSLNLRAEPSLNSHVITQIPQGVTVAVEEQGEIWSKVSYNGLTGYAMSQYMTFASNTGRELTAEEKDSEAAEDGQEIDETGTTGEVNQTGDASGTNHPGEAGETGQASGIAIVTTPSGSLNLRAQDSSGSQIVSTIPQNAQVKVLAYNTHWCQVSYSGLTGYVMTQYLSFQGAQAAFAPSPSGEAGYSEMVSPADVAAQTETIPAWVDTPSGSLNLRESPSAKAAVLASIPQYGRVEIMIEDGTWSQVCYNELVGYVMSEYLSFEKPAKQPVKQTEKPESFEENVESEEEYAQEYVALREAEPTKQPKTKPVEKTMAAQPEGLVLDETLRPVEQETFALANPEDWKSMLALWAECTESGVPLADILRGEQVNVLMRGKTWSQVGYGHQTGYCLTEYLTFLGE